MFAEAPFPVPPAETTFFAVAGVPTVFAAAVVAVGEEEQEVGVVPHELIGRHRLRVVGAAVRVAPAVAS